MGLTKISTDGVKDDAITKAKIPADQIEASELANNAVDTNAIADQAVTLAKLPHGDTNNDGKFLRANNGADPSFETVTSTSINNNANNRVITGSNTPNALEAEANLSYTGTSLIVQSGAHDGGLEVLAANNNQTTRIKIQGKHSGGSERNWFIEVPRGSDILNFFDDSHGSHTQLIDNGDLSIVDGNLALASGHGIDFSATGGPANGTGSTELLNDYEEGNFQPTMQDGNGSNTVLVQNSTYFDANHYVKIGRTVHIWGNIELNDTGKSGEIVLTGLPFTAHNEAMLACGQWWMDRSAPNVDTIGGVIYKTASNGNAYFVNPTGGASGGGNANNRYFQFGDWANGRYIYYGLTYRTT